MLAQKGITGLVHFSKADKETWNNFYQHWDKLVEESQRLIAARVVPEPFNETSDEEVAPLSTILTFPSGSTVQPKVVMTRVYQSFFRKAVLSSYQYTCCMCGMDIPQLLVASHIKPWAMSEETRTDPENGLCLCVLHDKAFDRGLLSINSEYQVRVSAEIKSSKVKFTSFALASFHNQKIKMPSRFAPKMDYLQWHMNNIFREYQP